MAAIARAFVLTARAKFNLRLEVGARRADGLHAVRSVIAQLIIGDDIAFMPSDGEFVVTCDDPAIGGDENLAWRAAKALGVDLPPVRIHVSKTIPLQAGLGGGSADAAATLLGLATILGESGVTLPREALLEAAARVGSDVVACLTPGMKIVEGAGEIVRPVRAAAPYWGLLLLKPSIGIATAQAYRMLDDARVRGDKEWARDAGAIDELREAVASSDFGRACALAHNDFQTVVEAAYPSIAEARLRLVASGAAATILCGSGSCVAGFFENVAEAQKALALVKPGRGEWAAATGFAHDR
jgi:4-diphosphocytidyl-2-C-methyl-D-erythritol kinase